MSVGSYRRAHPRATSHYRGLVERLLAVALSVETFELASRIARNRLPLASAALRRVDQGEGVLILTDVYGASPSNLAARLTQLGTPARRVAGLNLPMLLRVCNYPEKNLDELAQTAVAGGKTGVILDHA